MPLTPGTTLGPYEIVSAIGAGSMGEVYKARDTRLDRTVAVARARAIMRLTSELAWIGISSTCGCSRGKIRNTSSGKRLPDGRHILEIQARLC